MKNARYVRFVEHCCALVIATTLLPLFLSVSPPSLHFLVYFSLPVCLSVFLFLLFFFSYACLAQMSSPRFPFLCAFTLLCENSLLAVCLQPFFPLIKLIAPCVLLFPSASADVNHECKQHRKPRMQSPTNRPTGRPAGRPVGR